MINMADEDDGFMGGMHKDITLANEK